MVHQEFLMDNERLSLFKYILCYGSSCKEFGVSINAAEFKYILCYGSSWVSVQENTKYCLFKYILCYGSSSFSARFLHNADLNTSYVMVHLRPLDNADIANINLNTSYVMVHLRFGLWFALYQIFKYILCYGSSYNN